MIKKIDNVNQYIYHYTNERSLLEFIVPTKKLRFGKLENTNDPMEYFSYKPGISYSKYDKNYEEIVGIIDSERNKYKIIAFCKDQSNLRHGRGYSKPRMWAQYGNLHRGACIVLDKMKFETTLKNNFKSSFYSKEISYIETEQHELEFTLGENVEAETACFVKDNINQLLFTKSSDWINENEMRYAIYSRKEYEFISIENSIVGIIFGHKCPELIMEKVIEEFSEIETSRLTWKNGYPSYCGINNGYSGYLRNQIHYNFIFYFSEKCQTFNNNEEGIKWAIDEYCKGERKKLFQMIHSVYCESNSTIYNLLYALDKLKDVRKEVPHIVR